MAEFALILPVFLVIVVGLLLFGRVFFYWIEANHLANETARWAVVDRNPYAPGQTLQEGARSGGQTNEFEDNTRVCIDFPEGGTLDLGDPVRVRVQQTFSVLGGWDIVIRGSSTMRIERLTNTTTPANYSAGVFPGGTCA